MKNRPNAIAIGYIVVELPAKYGKIQKRIIEKDGIWYAETIADTIKLENEILSFDSKLIDKVELIPATLDTFHVINFNAIPTNARYSQIKTHIVSDKGSFSEWRELNCVQCYDISIDWIIDLQKKLKAKGYDVDISNKFDRKTKAALAQFQKDNGFKVGELDNDTLKALKIKRF